MIYTAKNDRLFKTIANGKDGKEILEALLGTIFNEKVEILQFIPVELSLDTEGERKKTLDVLVRVDKSIINVEMNAQGLSEIVKIRNLSYLCKLFSNNIKKGEVMRLNKNTKFIREISEEEERLMISKQEGQTQGYSDGKKEGMKQKNIEVIKNLIKLKMPIKTIAIATDLTEEEVKKRIKEFKLEE